MSIWAVVPAKDFATAKQRLVDVLSPDERRTLFRAMFVDVLTALGQVRGLGGILVVTRDSTAAALAAAHGAEVLEEPANRGQSAAVTTAAEHLAARGESGLLQLPGDLPLVTVEEVEIVLRAHRPGRAMTIVPAHDGRGSNCILLSPPDAVPFQFGNDSFRPHLAVAAERGIEPTVVRLPGIGLDIDTPADLLALIGRPAETGAHRYLIESGIAERLTGGGLRTLSAG